MPATLAMPRSPSSFVSVVRAMPRSMVKVPLSAAGPVPNAVMAAPATPATPWSSRTSLASRPRKMAPAVSSPVVSTRMVPSRRPWPERPFTNSLSLRPVARRLVSSETRPVARSLSARAASAASTSISLTSSSMRAPGVWPAPSMRPFASIVPPKISPVSWRTSATPSASAISACGLTMRYLPNVRATIETLSPPSESRRNEMSIGSLDQRCAASPAVGADVPPPWPVPTDPPDSDSGADAGVKRSTKTSLVLRARSTLGRGPPNPMAAFPLTFTGPIEP